MSGLRIGILVDSALKQQYLSNLVAQAGHRIGFVSVLNSKSVLPDIEQDVDAWVVDLSALGDEDSALTEFLDRLLEDSQHPVIVNDGVEFGQGNADYNAWVKRILQRLERLSGDISLQRASSASEVWVLAASTGGPAVVKEFVSHLPAALNVAFVYVQHIDSGQAETLVKMISSAGHYPATIAKQGTALIKNTVTLVTAECSLSIHDNGTLILSKSPWTGIYAPSIDQVAANVARVYRNRSGIIIFSGLGDDGAASCRFIKQQGGKVWAQNPQECMSTSMPEAAIATATVSQIGSPQDLAKAFTAMKMR